jgi:hypothetical protein
LTFANRPAGSSRQTAPEPLPERLNWAAVRPRGLDFFLAIAGIAVSWVPARDPSFVSLSMWDAAGLVAGYSIGGYILSLVLIVLARQLRVFFQRALSYTILYDYAERAHGELVRQALDNGRLAQTVEFLCDIVSESIFEISDVTMRDNEVEVALH